MRGPMREQWRVSVAGQGSAAVLAQVVLPLDHRRRVRIVQQPLDQRLVDPEGQGRLATNPVRSGAISVQALG
jgi:hypothetical protein